MIGHFLRAMVALMFGLVALSASADGGDIKVLDPWVQAAPPNVNVLAAYMEIKNDSGNPRILVKVSSPAFDQAGIHRSMMHGDMVHMEELKELNIPAHASEVLKPGGLHLMLTGAKKPLNIGDQVPMTLTFRSGEKIEVKAIVRSGQMEGMEGQQHMNHSGHGSH